MLFQGIFALLALASASANVEKRTIKDGTGDATVVGSHFAFGYNGIYFSEHYIFKNSSYTLCIH